jgi:hypothetical protein
VCVSRMARARRSYKLQIKGAREVMPEGLCCQRPKRRLLRRCRYMSHLRYKYSFALKGVTVICHFSIIPQERKHTFARDLKLEGNLAQA